MEQAHAAGDHELISTSSQFIEEVEPFPKISFTATAYAVLEHEQKVEIHVKRTGPTDVPVRFRWLTTFALTITLFFTFIHCMPTLCCNDTLRSFSLSLSLSLEDIQKNIFLARLFFLLLNKTMVRLV